MSDGAIISWDWLKVECWPFYSAKNCATVWRNWWSIQGHHDKITKKLSIHEELAIIEATLDNPGAYLQELQQLILQSIGTNVSTSTICSFKQQGFSRRKLTFRAQQQSEELRQKFMAEASVYEPQMLVFIDETGSDKRSWLRKYGYSPKGTPAIAEKKMLVRGKRHSAIAAICMVY